MYKFFIQKFKSKSIEVHTHQGFHVIEIVSSKGLINMAILENTPYYP